MANTMLAAVFEGEGKLTLKQVPIPKVEKGDDVIVKVKAASICGSDVRILAVPPEHPANMNTILGHEFSAEVVDVGGDVTNAKVGDFVVTLPDGSRVVFEAKNAARLTVGGKGGVLAELDTAMANRGGRFGVCVSSSDDAYPAEVGCFSLYGNRLLIADDGSGTLIRAALRWAAAAVRSDRATERPVDVAEIADGVARIHELATRISNAKRTLSTVRSGVDQARNDLDALRDDLLERVDEITRRLGPVAQPDGVRVA